MISQNYNNCTVSLTVNNNNNNALGPAISLPNENGSDSFSVKDNDEESSSQSFSLQNNHCPTIQSNNKLQITQRIGLRAPNGFLPAVKQILISLKGTIADFKEKLEFLFDKIKYSSLLRSIRINKKIINLSQIYKLFNLSCNKNFNVKIFPKIIVKVISQVHFLIQIVKSFIFFIIVKSKLNNNDNAKISLKIIR